MMGVVDLLHLHLCIYVAMVQEIDVRFFNLMKMMQNRYTLDSLAYNWQYTLIFHIEYSR